MRTAVIITGASRGFGRCMAVDFGEEINDSDVDMHLWARDEHDLQETERLVRTAWNTSSPGNTLRTFVQLVDLGSYADYAPKVDELLLQLGAATYNRIYLIHNAGSLGDLGYVQEIGSHDTLSKYFEFNVTSMMWLDKRFLEVYGASRADVAGEASSNLAPSPVLTIVNITSLCALEPFSTHGLYCTGKAAREMHLKVISKEQPASKVRTLSYSPGPMDTGMQRTIREDPRVDKTLSGMYASMHTEGRLIPPAVSSKIGVKLVLSDEFENAAHVDYYDVAR